jgi:hypothetical protein
MEDGSKFLRLRKMMDLQAEIDELGIAERLLKKIESKYQQKGKKRLVSKLTKATESIGDLKESLQQNLTDGLSEINDDITK